ncbi:MAG TPA: hypothetical protein VM689_13765 [Aliidongia sp.]|nr:hypothetical protein [Aliidongia sp.]
MRNAYHAAGLAFFLAFCAQPASAQEFSTPNAAVTAPPADSSAVQKPGSAFDGPQQPAPALRFPSPLAGAGSGNLPGQDLADGTGAGENRVRLSPAETDSLFNSKDFEQSMQLYSRPAHGGHEGPARQFGQAGEAMLGNLAIMGVAAAIEGHLPDGH